MQKNCLYCNQEFTARATTTKYCSHKCNQRHYKQKRREKNIDKALSENNLRVLSAIRAKNKGQTVAPPQQEEFLSIPQACELMGVSRGTVYGLINKNTLKITKLGRRTIIKKSEILKLFNHGNNQ